MILIAIQILLNEIHFPKFRQNRPPLLLNAHAMGNKPILHHTGRVRVQYCMNNKSVIKASTRESHTNYSMGQS